MLSRWPIRYKLLFGVAVLFLTMAILSFSSFRGAYSYRQLARSIRVRASELPYSAELTRSVGELRFTISRARLLPEFPHRQGFDPVRIREEFRSNLLSVRDALTRYRDQLDPDQLEDPWLGDYRNEWEAVREIERTLDRIERMNQNQDWLLPDAPTAEVRAEVDHLHVLSDQLPSHLQRRMHDFAGEVRGQYRTWIILTWVTSALAAVMLLSIVQFFHAWIFQPLRLLVEGSRRVARGEFNHRIELRTGDEVAELGGAMNAMTDRFQQIRDDLDEQVQARTKEVIRSEKLASVGFLAAGVAHEINNPLASIAWSAESLESRLHDIIDQDDQKSGDEHNEEITVLRTYLRRIQDEAFRCKGITDSLLDYSRIGEVQRQPTELHELINGVIEMVRHLGRYREKRIRFVAKQTVMVSINPQEVKQVVLNLITNALDSLEPNGVVTVDLKSDHEEVEIVVTDNGCGMDGDVLKHLFEPFFTRRKDGQGTGLGLSISYQIVSDHGGKIEAHSEGPGKGSQIVVSLPKVCHEEVQAHTRAA